MTQPIDREAYVKRILDRYLTLPGTLGHVRRTARRLAGQLHQRGIPVELVEAAEVPPTRMVTQGVAAAATNFLIGAPAFELRGQKADYYNSAYLIGPRAEVLGKYDKAHLVPYGEYTPFKEYLPFLGKIVEHVGDFKAGEKGKTLDWMDRKLGIQICYEIIFPGLARAQVRNGAALLITITTDAWYGKTAGPYQHFSLAVLRAVENRRALARAANTGISGFVDPVGRVLDPTPFMEEAAVVSELPLLDSPPRPR